MGRLWEDLIKTLGRLWEDSNSRVGRRLVGVEGGSRMRGGFSKIGGQRWCAGWGRVSGRPMVPRGARGIVGNRK